MPKEMELDEKGKVKDLRYGDLCPRCNAASGIDTCPILDDNCPLDVGKVLPKNYYTLRRN